SARRRPHLVRSPPVDTGVRRRFDVAGHRDPGRREHRIGCREGQRMSDTSGSDHPQRRRVQTPSRVESPSPEVEHPADSARIPGVRGDGYTRMPTGPVGVTPVVATGPADTAGAPAVQWAPADQPIAEDNSRLAPWALVAAIVALIASWFV